MSNKIKVLSEQLTNLIAAGEVIDRPMNVIKELVENSIDANATKIDISLLDCGIKSIKVLDNGDGISQNDLELAITRHATSKIFTEEDLFKICSLGFRGEALASIASVSDFKISSNNGLTNNYLHLTSGKIIDTGISNIPKGTLIEVNNLFFNTPARYKHLGNEYQELSLISEYIDKLSISNPNISFSLTNNNKLLFKTNGNNDLLEVINDVYGNKITKNMIPFSNSNNYYQISGYTTSNDVYKSNRNSLTIIVNGRIIKNLSILYAITNAYQTILPVGKYPITILKIECPYSYIDVNVHPSKLEIRFMDEESLVSLITKTIKSALYDNELLKYEKVETESFTNQYPISSNEVHYVESKEEIEEDEDWSKLFKTDDVVIIEPKKEVIEKEEYDNTTTLFEDSSRSFFQNFKYIGQYDLTYLLFEDDHTLYLIDQHAAMERWMYENIKRIFKENKHHSITLLVPITLEFNKSEIILIDEIKDNIKALGIDFSLFGETTIIVRAIPSWIPKNLEIAYLSDIFNHYMHKRNVDKLIMNDSLAKSLSCKKSIKANMSITYEEVQTLLKNLDSCEMPYTCPHGRPTLIKFTKYEIEKLFKRVNQ